MAKTFSQKPHCGVVGISNFTDCDYQKAFALCKEVSSQQRFHGATSICEREAALRRLNASYIDHGKLGKTVRDFCVNYAKPNKLYLVTITNHVVTIKNGMVTDQGGTDSFENKCRLKRIVNVLEKL